MLTIKVRIIVAFGLFLAFIFIIHTVVKKKMDVKYALPWLFMLVALTAIDVFPEILNIVSRLMGIGSPANMLFFLGFCFSLIIIYFLTTIVYSISNRLRKVAQDLAILKNEIETKELKEK